MIQNTSPNSSLAIDETDPAVHRFSYDQSDRQSICVSITQAVASVSGVDPLSLRPRLYDVIDSDALETLLSNATSRPNVRLSFSFGAHTVTVTGDEDIFVRENGAASH